MKNDIHIPSKKSIRNAGDILRSSGVDIGDWVEAFGVLSDWRALHSYPINTFQSYLRLRIKKDYPKVIVAQRLKRTPSIINKLQRFPSMSLDRMQDIGGLRIIAENINQVNEIHSRLIKARFKHTPELPPKDYINEPKSDGYRSLHQVFKYSNKLPGLNGLRIELQIRTILQHSWATAVETLGIIEHSSFKTGEGSDKFKEFFKLSSALFSFEEKSPILKELESTDRKDIVYRIVTLEHELQIFSKLEGIALTAKHIETSSRTTSGYHLMELDLDKNTISLTPFTQGQLEQAEFYYKTREEKTKDNRNISVVLISAGNINEIKKAYPNYFLDTNAFIKKMKKLINTSN